MATPATLYEAMYILDLALSDEQMAEVSKNLAEAVAAAGGEIQNDELFGRRRLAYPINGHTEGVYRLLYFRADGAIIPEVKHQFSLIEGIVRGMVVVANPKATFPLKDKERPEAPAEAAAAATPAEAPAPEAAPEPEAAAEPVTEAPAVEPPVTESSAEETPAEAPADEAPAAEPEA